MSRYRSNGKINKKSNGIIKRFKKMIIRGAIGAIGALAVAQGISEIATWKRIEENTQLKKIPRSMKNIDEENMGKYLKAEIKRLYETYPDIDDLMYKNSSETKNQAFIDEVYRLYKAYMVDQANEKIFKVGKAADEEVNINGVRVTTVDQIIFHSDLIQKYNNNGELKKIISTHKEQYKAITDAYIAAKNGEITGAELANKIYELLALELGVTENTLTSEQINQKIKEDGFYYDPTNNIFYTTKGRGTLVYENENENENTQNSVEEDKDGWEH